MSKLVSIALCLIFSSAVVCGDIPYSLCPGTDGSMIALSHVGADPWPIVKGKSAAFLINGDAKVDINQKSARMDIYLGSSKIFSTAAGGINTTSAGKPYSYSFSYTIPSFVPPGTYDVRVNMVDGSGKAYTCVRLSMHF